MCKAHQVCVRQLNIESKKIFKKENEVINYDEHNYEHNNEQSRFSNR